MSEREFVCVPVNGEQLRLLAAGQTIPGPLQAFTSNDELLATFGLTPADDEEADFACLLVAGLWALTRYGRRLVVTANVDPDRLFDGPEAENGGRSLQELPVARVEAWFSDEDQAAVAEAGALVNGLDIDAAWERPEIERLLREQDLMWHSVVELGSYEEDADA